MKSAKVKVIFSLFHTLKSNEKDFVLNNLSKTPPQKKVNKTLLKLIEKEQL